MKHRNHEQAGVALITALFALLLLSAIAVGMMYMSSTDTSVNANFKDSQTAYWGARAGMEEVRARMHPGTTSVAAGDLVAFMPTLVPKPTNAGSVVYITNPDGGTAINPQTAANAYFDNEICNNKPGAGTDVYTGWVIRGNWIHHNGQLGITGQADGVGAVLVGEGEAQLPGWLV